MRPRYLVLACVLTFATIAGLGLLALGIGGGAASIEEASVRVTLNDELTGEGLDTGEDGVATCTTVGPPPDHLSVSLDGTIDSPTDAGYDATATYDLVVRLGNATDRRQVRVGEGASEHLTVPFLLEDDETVTPGDEATVTVSLVHDGRTVDAVERTATVRESNLECVDDGG